MSNDDLMNKYFDKLDQFLLVVKDPLNGDEDVRQKMKIFNMYINQWQLDGIYPLTEDFIFGIREEIQPFYTRLMNEIQTEDELEIEYDELSELVQNLYPWYQVLGDWRLRQDSKQMYEDYSSIFDKPYFTEEELQDAYQKSVDRPLYEDDNRMQVLSWMEFRKRHENKIVKTRYAVDNGYYQINFTFIPCEIEKFEYLLMGQTEITQQLFETVMGWNNSEFQYKNGESLQYPIERVTWYDCIDFCNKLSTRCGLEICYEMSNIEKNGDHISYADVIWIPNRNGFRLPTQKEWQTCAQAGTQNKWSGTNRSEYLDQYAWFYFNSSNETHAVKKLRPNEWGFYDMSGNVWEWCWDLYDPKYEKRRVVCGGAYNYDTNSCRVDTYDWCIASFRSSTKGFRVCRSFVVN